MFRLRTYEVSPPGGFIYQQTQGITRKFKGPLIEAIAGQVADFRKANGLPRASVREALEDVDHYTCERLGNMAQWCVSCDPKDRIVALAPTHPIVAPPCAGCGAPVQ